MRQLISRFIPRSKLLLAMVVFGVAVAVPSLAMASLGDDRPTIAYTDINTKGFDHVAFNSMTGVPNVGDERNFLNAKVSGVGDSFQDPLTGLKAGDEILMRVYVDNNADTSKNADGSGVARNTRIRVELPTATSKSLPVKAFVSADNAQPQIVEDDATISSAAPMSLQYETDSATIVSNYQDKPISDDVVKGGVLIGDDNLNGDQRAGIDRTSLVTFKLRVVSPTYDAVQRVEKLGATQYNEGSISANVGDKLTILAGVENNGKTDINNAVIHEDLPAGLTYDGGTSEWISGYTNNAWMKVQDDAWLTNGLQVYKYGPNGAAYVRFHVTVSDSPSLTCGTHDLIATTTATADGLDPVKTPFTVTVTKPCAPAQQAPAPQAPATPAEPASSPSTPTIGGSSCDSLQVSQSVDASGNRLVQINHYQISTASTATYSKTELNWGDGSEIKTTNLVQDQSHIYAQDGSYTITATTYFLANGATDAVPVTSLNCTVPVSFVSAPKPAAPAVQATAAPAIVPVASVTSTATTPQTLVNTGAGDVFSVFIVVSLAAAAGHWYYQRRRAL